MIQTPYVPHNPAAFPPLPPLISADSTSPLPKKQPTENIANPCWICEGHHKLVLIEKEHCNPNDLSDSCSRLHHIYGFQEGAENLGWACVSCFILAEADSGTSLLTLNAPYQVFCKNSAWCGNSRVVRSQRNQVRQVDAGVWYTWQCLRCRDGLGKISYNDVAYGPRCVANEFGQACPVRLDDGRFKPDVLVVPSAALIFREYLREKAHFKHAKVR
ncbi:hypothetical protein J1614_005066 [Plenodomus biglobosus]|nr:hypothetical protein J1614_005066 [Plenodomus biglobosus]